MHKVKKRKAIPDTITSMFNVNNNSIYNLRNNNTDKVCLANFMKKSIAYSGASVILSKVQEILFCFKKNYELFFGPLSIGNPWLQPSQPPPSPHLLIRLWLYAMLFD